MTWAKGRAEIKGFVSKFGSKYAGVVPDDAKIPASVLNPYAQARDAHAPKVLSKFNTALSGASKGGLARRQPDKFVSLKQDSKHFISTGGAAGRRAGRQFKEEEAWLVALVKRRWLSGDPISTDEIKIHMLARFGVPAGPDDTAVEGGAGVDQNEDEDDDNNNDHDHDHDGIVVDDGGGGTDQEEDDDDDGVGGGDHHHHGGADHHQLQQEGGQQAARGAVHPQDLHPRWTEPVVREHRRVQAAPRRPPVYGVLLTPNQALDNIEAALLANQFELMLVL